MPLHQNLPKRHLVWIVSLALLVSLNSGARAATRTWTGSVSSDWFIAANWNPTGVPVPADTVAIPAGASVDLSKNAAVTGFTLAGNLTGAGTLTLTGTGSWTEGDIAGHLNVTSSGQLSITGTAEKRVTRGALINQGKAVWTGSGRISMTGGGVIRNSGIFEVQNDAPIVFCCETPPGTFWNLAGGIFRKTNSSGTNVFESTFFNNDGIVEIQSGVLALGGGGTGGGSFSNMPAGRVEFTGGTHTLKSGTISGISRITGGTVTLDGTQSIVAGGVFELVSGTLNGTGTVNGPGVFDWVGGDLSADLTIAAAGNMKISSQADKRLFAARLFNQGKVIWTGAGNIVGVGGGTITNSGLFEIQNDASFTYCCVAPQGSLQNLADGIVRKTAAIGTTIIGDFRFANWGTLDIQSGAFTLAGNQECQINAGGHFGGAGKTRIEGATVTLNGASTLDQGSTFELTAGTLNGDGAFSGSGTFLWTGGDLTGALQTGPTTSIRIEGSAEKRVAHGALANGGKVLWTGSGRISVIGGGVIRNSGIFEVQNDAQVVYCCVAPPGTFWNQPGGIFRKTNSSGTNVFESTFFNNDGIIEIQSGVLSLGGGGTGSGSFSNLPAGRVEFSGGTQTLKSGTISGISRINGGTVTLEGTQSIVAGGIFELVSGTLNGTGTINGPGVFEWVGGDLSADLTLAATGTMKISSQTDKRLYAARLFNQGKVIWTGTGNIFAVGGGTITNRGLFEIQNDAKFTYCCIAPPGSFQNLADGIVRKTAAIGTTTFENFQLANWGIVDIQSGTLALTVGYVDHQINTGGHFSGAGKTRIEGASVNLNGASTLDQGATLEFTAGTLRGVGGFSGPGTFLWTGGDLTGSLTINAGTTLSISGDTEKRLYAGTINNFGTIVWTGRGNIPGFADAVINNSGIFEARNDQNLTFCCVASRGTFNNLAGGKFKKLGSGGQTDSSAWVFNNEGTLSIQSGTFRLSDDVLADGTHVLHIIVGVCPVSRPSLLSVHLADGPNKVRLNWSHQLTDEDGAPIEFQIERKIDDGPYAGLDNVGPEVRQYATDGSCDGPKYTFRIRGLGDSCNSSYSNEATLLRGTAPPAFASKASDLAAAEKPFTYNAHAEDSTGERITYSLVRGPVGMTIDPSAGVVAWTPPSAMRGQTIPVSISAFSGACGTKGQQDFTLSIGETPPPGGFKLRVGKVEISADSVLRLNASNLSPQSISDGRRITTQTEIEDGTYQLGGDTRINDYVHFDGSVVVTLNKAAATMDVKVNEGKVYLTNIPLIGNKTIWEGGKIEFTVDGDGEVTKLLQEQIGRRLQAGGMDIDIERAKLLLEGDLGIRIFGKLNFPDVAGISALSAHFENLEISRNNGVRFTGEIALSDFTIGGMGVKNVLLNWMPQLDDPTKDIFEGEGDLLTPAFRLATKVRLVAGALDGVYANLDLNNVGGISVPPAPAPFFNITGGGLGVVGLRQGPFSVRLDCNLTVVHAAMKNVIALDKAGIIYTYPSTIKGTGDLRILTAKAAKAFLNLNLPYSFKFGGKVELIEAFPVLIISADLAAGVNPDPLRFFLEGGASGKLQIPPYDNFPDGIKKAFPPLILTKPFLPKTLAQASIAYRNNTFSSSIGLPVIGDIVVAVKYAQSQVQFLVGNNLTSLKRIIGLSELQAAPGVVIAPGTERVIFRLFAEKSAPRYRLIKPDGAVLTPEANGGVYYQEIAESKETYYVVTSPAAGTWKAEAEDATQGPFMLDAWGANAPPAITSVLAAQNGGNVAISYNVSDPDDVVTVSLYYDTDTSGFDGVLIAENLPESATGSYVWNAAAANLPSGDYYIYATADDDKNVPAQRYATTKITLVDPNAPAMPKNVKVQPGGENSLLITWDADTQGSLPDYQINYAVEGDVSPELTEVVDAGKTNAFRLRRLESDTTYRVTVSAYTQTEAALVSGAPNIIIRKSLASATLTAKTETAKPPVVRITSPNGGERVLQNSSLTISWKLEDAEDGIDQQVELSTDGGGTWRALAKHLAASQRNYAWDVPLSLQTSRARIRVSVLDGAGNEGVDASDENFAIAGVDTDGDGLPDSWELANGFNPNAKGDEAADTDNDGLTNLQEFRSGTNPKDPASAFRVTRVLAITTGIQITFSTESDRQYVVESTHSLDNPTWTIVEDLIEGAGGSKQITDTSAAESTSRFYRVRLVE